MSNILIYILNQNHLDTLDVNNIYLITGIYNLFNLSITDVLSLGSIISSILVIISKNPIISVLFLIALFLFVASYLISLGATFIGLSYLLVYIGAVSILFLFILMLINIRISELLSETSKSIPLVFIIALFFNIPLWKVLPNLNFENENINFIWNSEINTVLTNYWDGNIIENDHITAIGNIMYTNYAIWLIITSIILLLAMVGSIVITIKRT